MESFVKAQFSYCPLVWMFSNRTLNTRINKLQERSLRILYRDDISTFEDLLVRDNSSTLHDHNIKLLAMEMYKAKHGIEPNLIGEFVTIREPRYNFRQISDFLKEKASSTTYVIWDLILDARKRAGNLIIFGDRIKKWKVIGCPCRLCEVFIRGMGYM